MVDDVTVRVSAPIDDTDVAIVRALEKVAATADGHPAIGDAAWRDLSSPSDRSAVIVASSGADPVGAVHVAPAENEPRQLTASIVVHPARRAHVVDVLADAVRTFAGSVGADHVVLWIFGVDEPIDAALLKTGFVHERELWQMRVTLPLAEEPRWPEGVHVRTFEPGRDEADWLHANNRAFAEDPDQRGWTLETLRRRTTESWFDPWGFLLAFDDAGLAGSCWTKLHPATPPHEPLVLGEIYVIGVDPDRQGTGLGRALVVAGLASLHERGAAVGMLFVDAANEAAIRLYRSMGFEVARVDRAYRGSPG